MEDALTNRERSRYATKRRLHWCDHCDGELVGDWGRCPNCRKRHDKRKIKEGLRRK